MRQTGRTTRIVHYVVEQLYNVGTCVATDHIAYEYGATEDMLKHFVEKVRREIDIKSYGSKKIKTTYLTIENIRYVKFELIQSKEE